MSAFIWGKSIEQLRDLLPQRFDGARRGFAEQRLELGEKFFDGIQIRGIRWEIVQRCARRGKGFSDSGYLVAAEVVENDLISRTQRGAEELPHPRKKHFAVHGTVGDHRRGQTIMPQATDKCSRFPMSLGSCRDAALASGSAAITPRHVGRSPGFIEKHQLFDVHDGLCFRPDSSRRLHVRAFLLVGVQSFF